MELDKPYLNYEEQVLKLKAKGLLIENESFAIDMLKKYGYYSLICGYKTPFKNRETKNYKAKATFEDIVKLYEFDSELRRLFLKYLLLVEKQIKVHLTTAFCETYSELQSDYLEPNNYWYELKKNQKDIDKLIRILRQLIEREEYPYIAHAKSEHGNVPLWVLFNAVTFGQVSKMYQVQYQSVKARIAREYSNVNEGSLGTLLRAAAICRNTCAHGERLYSFRMKEIIPQTVLHTKLHISVVDGKDEFVCGQRDLFAIVIVLRYLLSDDDFKNFKKALSTLVDNYVSIAQPDISRIVLREMGFPENWKSITRFRKLS